MGLIKSFKNIFGNTGDKTTKIYRFNEPLILNTNSKNIVTRSLLKTMPDIVAAINLIANDVSKAKLSINKTEYDNENGIKSSKNQKLNNYTYILSRAMNEFQTPREFLKMYIHHIYEAGRFAAFIHRVEGVVKELIPLDPESVTPYTKDGKKLFKVGDNLVLQNKDIIFISWEDAIGYSDVDFIHQFQSMLTMFADLYELDSSLLSNKTNFMAHIEVPEDLGIGDPNDPDAESQLNQIKQRYQSMISNSRENGNGVMVTDPKWSIKLLDDKKQGKKSTLDSESQKDLMRKISRAFNIPMSYLGYQEDQTTDAAEVTIGYMKRAIQPWIELFVDKINLKLFGSDMTKEVTYDMSSLLKLSLKELADVTTKLANAGAITVNEIRTRFLDLPSVDYGDMILGNSTLIPIKEQADKIKAETKLLKKQQKEPKPDKNEKGGEDG